MAGGRESRRHARFKKFDQSFIAIHGCIAGVDEVGRGPLAGPVVAAAVILPDAWKLPHLNDSKQLSAAQRNALFPLIQSVAIAIGVGIVDHLEIDRINIRQASFLAMRIALEKLIASPAHVLVDGFKIPQGPPSQTGVIGGDGKSAHIAAASVIAKVTRDRMMETFDLEYPEYGFKQHKGYGTTAHLAALKRHGPCPIHRLSFAPVKMALERQIRSVSF